MGPGDVTALNAGAVVPVYPAPHTADAETTKCVYAERQLRPVLAHTPQKAAGKVLRPWIVLVVGTLSEGNVVGDIAFQPGNRVQLRSAVTLSHPLADSARWAHIQIGLRNSQADPGALSDEAESPDSTEGGSPLARLIRHTA